MRTRSSRVVKEDEVEPYISPASDDGDDDDSPEEVSIKTVRLEAKQQRKREVSGHLEVNVTIQRPHPQSETSGSALQYGDGYLQRQR